MLAKQRARHFEALRGSARGRELFWSDARCARGSVRGEEPWELLDGARELERRALRARLCSRSLGSCWTVARELLALQLLSSS